MLQNAIYIEQSKKKVNLMELQLFLSNDLASPLCNQLICRKQEQSITTVCCL